jgi:hypothetical protein
MRPRPVHCLLSLALVSCGLTEPDEEGTTITTDFTTQFVETSVHQGGVTLTCSDTYTLSGTLTFIVRDATGGALDGEGRLTAGQTHVSTSGQGCTPTPDRPATGAWTADLAGTPAEASFVVEQTGTGSFPYVTRFSFSGVISANSASGTLTFTQTAQGTTGGTTQSSSSAQAAITVTLH